MTPGPPPTPIEVKRKRGTLRPDRLPGRGANLVGLEPIDQDAAIHLTPLEALLRVLDAAPWLGESDLVTVVLFRDALDYAAVLREDPRAKPSEVIAAYKFAGQLASALGLTPTDRSKLGLAEVRAASKLDEMRQRSQTRGGGA